MLEQVILVDEQDRPVGMAEKLHAHQAGLCHRAFSVFVFRERDGELELLLQQRHPDKYHSGGLWSNTCCSHPRVGEQIIQAARRRLREEMGFVVDLHEAAYFHYTASVGKGLTENEVDHILLGWYDGENVQPDVLEVSDYQWIAVHTLQDDLRQRAAQYTPWFEAALNIALMAVQR